MCFKEALEPGFKAYQKQVIDNAQVMADVFIKRGYDVVSGGTDNHLFLVSLIRQGLTGKDADAALGRAHITVNKNAVPNDPQSPFVTSGLFDQHRHHFRLGATVCGGDRSAQHGLRQDAFGELQEALMRMVGLYVVGVIAQ